MNLEVLAFGEHYKDALGMRFISYVSQNASTIGQKLGALSSNSDRVLGFLIVLQVGAHIARGDYPKAIAEIAKVVLSTFCAPAALIDLIDLIDSLIGLFLPTQWQQWSPFAS